MAHRLLLCFLLAWSCSDCDKPAPYRTPPRYPDLVIIPGTPPPEGERDPIFGIDGGFEPVVPQMDPVVAP